MLLLISVRAIVQKVVIVLGREKEYSWGVLSIEYLKVMHHVKCYGHVSEEN